MVSRSLRAAKSIGGRYYGMRLVSNLRGLLSLFPLVPVAYSKIRRVMPDSNSPSLFDAIDGQGEVKSHQGEPSDGAATGAGAVSNNTAPSTPTFVPPDNLIIQSSVPVYIEPKADLVVGDTGSGKTTNIGEVSDYVLKKYGKLTRMVGADKGGFGPLTGMVKSGQISYWAVNAWKNPIAAMHKAVRGYWPLR